MTHKKNEYYYPIEFFISLSLYHLTFNSTWEKEIVITDKNSNKNVQFRYRNYPEIGLYLPLFGYTALLDNISSSKIIELIRHILLEHKIILIRTEFSNNAEIIEALLQLIAPLYIFTLN